MQVYSFKTFRRNSGNIYHDLDLEQKFNAPWANLMIKIIRLHQNWVSMLLTFAPLCSSMNPNKTFPKFLLYNQYFWLKSLTLAWIMLHGDTGNACGAFFPSLGEDAVTSRTQNSSRGWQGFAWSLIFSVPAFSKSAFWVPEGLSTSFQWHFPLLFVLFPLLIPLSLSASPFSVLTYFTVISFPETVNEQWLQHLSPHCVRPAPSGQQ